ncbi:hypothetical protein QQM79_03710 [Marinobacteraceae bacterium S3BR75-40.1]
MKNEMNYTLSHHGRQRACQRAIGNEVIDFLMLYGDVHEQKGGGYLLTLNDRDRKRLQKALKRVSRSLDGAHPPSVVVGDEARVITVERLYGSFRSNQ